MARAEQRSRQTTKQLLRAYESAPPLLRLLIESEGGLPSDLALDSEQRKVCSNDGTPYINPTAYGQRTLSIEVGDSVEVSTFPDCIVIWTPEDEGGVSP